MKTEGQYLADWLKYEDNPNYCRKEVTIYTSAAELPSGQVLGTDGANVAAYDNDTTYVTAVGILIHPVDASAGPAKGVMLCKGPAIVISEGLTWGSSNDTSDIAAGVADLEALGIKFGEVA